MWCELSREPEKHDLTIKLNYAENVQSFKIKEQNPNSKEVISLKKNRIKIQERVISEVKQRVYWTVERCFDLGATESVGVERLPG